MASGALLLRFFDGESSIGGEEYALVVPRVGEEVYIDTTHPAKRQAVAQAGGFGNTAAYRVVSVQYRFDYDHMVMMNSRNEQMVDVICEKM